jgi:hypothetical protein
MLDTQTVIITNVATMGALAFFVRLWINGVNERIKEMSDKLDGKVEDKLCIERRGVYADNLEGHCDKNNKDFREAFGRIRTLEGRE